MKFLELTFRCFGPFEECRLDFTRTDGLQVIHGLNEAGKSTSLRGIKALLFKFEDQFGCNFRFAYNQFRIQATVSNLANETLTCVRRKGKKDTLRESDDRAVIADRIWDEFLGGMTQQKFDQFYGLDAKGLLAGSKEISEGKGDVGGPLFEAGAGLRGLRALATRLESEQALICKSTMRTGQIPELKTEYQRYMDQIRECSLPPEAYEEAVKQADSTDNQATTLRKQRVDLRTQISRLTRFSAALPTIAQLEIQRSELQMLVAAPILPHEFEELHRTALSNRHIAEGAQSSTVEKLKTLHEKLAALSEGDAILKHEEEVRRLSELFGADQKQREERRSAETFRISEEGSARDIYRELTGSRIWDDMPGWKLRTEERSRLSELGTRHSGVLQAVERETEAADDLRTDLAKFESQLKAAAIPIDTSAWESLVSSIAKLGPLEQNAVKRQRDQAQAAKKLDSEFQQFNPTIPGKWDTIGVLRTPSREEIEAFRQEWKAANDAVVETTKALRETDTSIADHNSRLATVESGEEVPTFASLTEARLDRDGGLQLIRRRLEGRPANEEEPPFITRHAAGRNVMDAAEASVRECDGIADRIRLEAARVANAETIRKQIALLEDRRIKQQADNQKATDSQAALDGRWRAVWADSGVDPRNPDVMLAWLKAWQEWSSRRSELQKAKEDLEHEYRQIETHRTRLITKCGLDAGISTLAEAIDRGQSSIRMNSEIRTAHERARDAVERTKADLEKAQRRLQQATTNRDEWQKEWSEAVQPLRMRETNPSVETVLNYVKRQDEMHAHLKDARIRAAKIREIDENRTRFIGRINAVRSDMAPQVRPTSDDTLDADLRDLERRLREAADSRSRRLEIGKLIEAETKNEAAHKASLQKANAQLESLRVQSGVTTLDDIQKAIQNARNRAIVSDRVEKLEKILADNLRGETMVEFSLAAKEHGAGIESKLLSLREEEMRLDEQIAEAEKLAEAAKVKLTGYQRASDRAAEARQQASLVASKLQDLTVEFAAIHLARQAIDKAKEQYRQKNQDNMLTKAGNYFRTLTDGAFSGLEIDNEEGKDVLKAVRVSASRPDGRVGVEGLSDGTRDQLFLALRLAGIDNHLNEREPFPLIVDDALINFDDKRTRSTLKCLAELAKKTQVLIFTHHLHVVDFAREVDTKCHLHELN